MDFEEIYRREFPKVYKFLLSLCRDPGLAEELTQETFYRAIQTSDTFRGECSFPVWLCQIGKNLYLSQLRQEKRHGTVSYDDSCVSTLTSADGDPEEALVQKDTAMTIHRRLHGLPEPYREVFSLRALGELSFSQIGEIFGKSESWARVTYHRAKLKLKEDSI